MLMAGFTVPGAQHFITRTVMSSCCDAPLEKTSAAAKIALTMSSAVASDSLLGGQNHSFFAPFFLSGVHSFTYTVRVSKQQIAGIQLERTLLI